MAYLLHTEIKLCYNCLIHQPDRTYYGLPPKGDIMKQQHSNFLSLIRSCLWETEPNLTSPDWEGIYELGRIHNLIPMIYEAARPLPAFSEASQDLQTKFMETAVYQSTSQFMKTQEFFTVYEKFAEAGLHPLVLKGLVCRSLYRQPDLRGSGDEDLWIQKEDWQTYDKILRDLGYHPKFEDITPILDTIQEAHYTGPLLTLELHINPFGTENHIRRHMNRVLQDAQKDSITLTIEGHTIHTLKPTDHYLFLFIHLCKHFLGGGVGIRQIMDLFLFRQTWEKEIDQELFEEGVMKLQEESLYQAVVEIGRRYLGFELPSFPISGQELDGLLDDLLESGCFGNTSRFQRLSSTYVASGIAARRKSRGSLRVLLFPPASSLYHRYSFLIKKPWLLPLAWCFRLGRFSKEALTTPATVIRSIKRGRRRMRLMDKYRMFR